MGKFFRDPKRANTVRSTWPVVLNIFIFNPTWGNDPIWLTFFRWLETTNQFCFTFSRIPQNSSLVTIVDITIRSSLLRKSLQSSRTLPFELHKLVVNQWRLGYYLTPTVRHSAIWCWIFCLVNVSISIFVSRQNHVAITVVSCGCWDKFAIRTHGFGTLTTTCKSSGSFLTTHLPLA